MLSQSLLNIVCKAYFYSVRKSFRNQLNQIKVTITVILYICAWFSTNRNRASASFIARNKPLSIILGKQEFVALTSMQLEEQSVAFSSNETPHGSEIHLEALCDLCDRHHFRHGNICSPATALVRLLPGLSPSASSR